MTTYTLYKISFPNSKVYIGLTSKSLEIRKKQHLYYAKQLNSHNKLPVHKAILKHKDSIIWEIIETNIASLKEASKKETGYIKFFDSSNRKFGYNATKGGGGVSMNKQTKQKLKTSLRAYFTKPLSKENLSIAKGGKAFYAISVASGLMLTEHKTQAEAAKAYGVLQAAISSCLRGKIYCVGDIAFRFNLTLELKAPKKSNPNRKLLSTKQLARWTRNIDVYDLKGNLLHTFSNVKTCVEALKLNSRGVSRVIDGERTKYKGMVFKAKPRIKPLVYLICGVSGSGKSWVCKQFAQHSTYISYDLTSKIEAKETMKKAVVPILYDPTVGISTFINKNQNHLDIKLIIILGDFLQVKQQLINRNGKVTKSLYRRWKRMKVLSKMAIFTGDSTEVAKFLKDKLVPANPIQ